MPQLASQAIKIIQNEVKFYKTEIINIEDSSHRVLAQDIYAKNSLPAYDISSMDGYALRFDNPSDILDTKGKIFAGDEPKYALEKGQTYKIMTGAILPKFCTLVVPQEQVEILENEKIKVPKDLKQNQFIRLAKEDIKIGELLISKNDEIDFSKIAILASQGISHIKVYQKAKVGIFSSGSELKNHYESIKPFQIYNSNSPSLQARVKELGHNSIFLGLSDDKPDSLKNLIKSGLDCDLIVSSGGTSVGEADFTRSAFSSFDFDYLIDGIYIKPGKPSFFGKIKNTYVLSLPGNPLASALIFEYLGKLILQKLSGSKNKYFSFIETKLKNSIDVRNKTTIVAGFFDGQSFEPSLKSSPAMVKVLDGCNGILIIDSEVKHLEKGSTVKVLPLAWKFFTQIKKDYFIR